MPLHHVSLIVSDIDKMREFYLAALKPLGYSIKLSYQEGKVLGFGVGWSYDFWLATTDAVDATGTNAKTKTLTGPMHLAFAASNRKQVREFYQAAIAAGAKDNGPPGPRPEYLATYYGAFVLDPEGRNIEAVCLKPGFIADSWGVLGWSTAIAVTGIIGAGIAQYTGLGLGLLLQC